MRKENVKFEMERDLLKKSGLLREGDEVRFGFMANHREVWPAAIMCEALDVWRSDF